MPRVALRVRAVQFGFFAAALVLVGRAAQVQLLEGATYQSQAATQRTEHVELPGPRGAIYDRNRVPLSLTHEMYHVGIDPSELRDTAATVDLLVDRLGVSRAYANRMLTRRYAYFHGPYDSRAVQPFRNVRGAYLTSELTRFYPKRDFARPVLGQPEAPGRPASGIERVLDSLLAGRSGSAVVLRDQFGRRYESPARLDAFPEPGYDVYLTIDAELQDIVEQSLAEAIDRLEAAGGDVIVMNPKTGELLAVAALRADGSTPPSMFTSVFEPGSTAKLFAAAALLEADLVEPDDSVWGENGRLLIGRRPIEDEHPVGWVSLGEVIRRSSNIGIIKFARRLTREQQYSTLRAFGFGSPTGVEFPVESAGILSRPRQWSSQSAPSLAIGYEVAVTMVQLAAAYAAIANDGVLLRPTLVHSIRAPDGRVVYEHSPEPVRRVVRPEVARELRAMLRGVVENDGTGSTAALVNYELAGKTGTARRAGPNGYVAGSYIASFASMFPANDPQLVMVVKLEDPSGTYARATAAPLTRSVLEQILAAQTGVLDPRGLSGAAAGSLPGPAVDEGVVPYVVSWPPEATPEAEHVRVVPRVGGMSVREAARTLHQAGLRVRASGSGTVDSIVPGAGRRVPRGTLVSVYASRPTRSR